MLVLRIAWRALRLFLRLLAYFVGLVILLFSLQRSTFPLGLQWNAVNVIVLDHQFDYVTWELQALGVKVNETLYGLHPFMNEADRAQFVRDYMAQLSTARQLEDQINRIYTDPAITDPVAASSELRAQRDALRADLQERQPLTEAILEGQVAAVLVDEGFGLLGQLLPPMAMHFTEVPNLLIVSPRDQIRFDISINLDPLPVDQKADLEARIDAEQDVASLIVPLGGLALYPAMIIETTSIPYALETFAHEWLHHYLFAFPLGLNYDFTGEARIINETTADLFGKEISRLVLQRYYPDLLPPPPVPPDPDAPPPPPPAFDFGAEMNTTRVTVDALLAAGEVEEAEAYMEARRQLFVTNGYLIRKLNQAYFAFYGGYQAGGVPGVGGEDPIGPALRDLRAASPSVHEWIISVRDITTREQLLQLHDALPPSASSVDP